MRLPQGQRQVNLLNWQQRSYQHFVFETSTESILHITYKTDK